MLVAILAYHSVWAAATKADTWSRVDELESLKMPCHGRQSLKATVTEGRLTCMRLSIRAQRSSKSCCRSRTHSRFSAPLSSGGNSGSGSAFLVGLDTLRRFAGRPLRASCSSSGWKM